jgi:AAA15 family ATPase/GTPase
MKLGVPMKQLVIKNFRGIKEGTIELSPLTILLGANNSGKSTILEALFLAPNPLRDVPYIAEDRFNQYDNNALNAIYYLHKTLEYRGYAFILHNYNSEITEIEHDFDDSKNILRFINEKNGIFVYSNKQIRALGSRKIGNKEYSFFAILQNNNIGYEASNRDIITSETLLINPNLTKPIFEYIKRYWGPIVNTKILRDVANIASELSPEIYMDFTLEPLIGGSLELYAYLKDGRRVRLGDLGAGMQTYILSRILCEWVKPKIILWDDIESHLNPRILRHIAEWFSDLLKNGKQIIISTHSLEAAKLIAGVNEEDTSICLTLLEDSYLKTKNIKLKELENLENAGIDPRVAEAFFL